MTPNPEPLTPDRLTEIDERAAHLFEYVPQTEDADQLAGHDVPALLAEAERLRAELAEIRAPRAGTDVDWLAEHVRQAVHYVLGQVEPRLDNKVRAVASEQAAIHIKAGSVPIITDRVVGLAVEYVKKAEAERDQLVEQVKHVRGYHRKHSCDGDPADCLCADDVAEQGGPVCGHCRQLWPCVTAAVLDRALDGGEAATS